MHRPGGDYYFDCLGGDRTLPHPRPVEGGMMMAIAVAGLLAIYFLSGYFITAAKRKTSTCESGTACARGPAGFGWGYYCRVIIIWTGWTPADPILSILVSLWFCVARGDC